MTGTWRRFWLFACGCVLAGCALSTDGAVQGETEVAGQTQALPFGYTLPRRILPEPPACWWADSGAECSALAGCADDDADTPCGPWSSPRGRARPLARGSLQLASGQVDEAAALVPELDLIAGPIAPPDEECSGSSLCQYCTKLPPDCEGDPRLDTITSAFARARPGAGVRCEDYVVFNLQGVPADMAGRMALTNGGSESAPVVVVDYVLDVAGTDCGLKWASIAPMHQQGVTDAIDFSEDFCVMFTRHYDAHPSYPGAQIPIDNGWYCCDEHGCEPRRGAP